MKYLAKILFYFYLLVISLIVFLPCGICAWIWRTIKPHPKESYFTEPKIQSSQTFQHKDVRCSGLRNWMIVTLLKPCHVLGRYFGASLFSKKVRPLLATPNQIGAIITSQCMHNVKALNALSENKKMKYIFALQPSLLYTGAQTKEDQIFYANKIKTRMWGFSYDKFVKTYYNELIKAFDYDEDIKNQFLNLSGMFKDKKEQSFVDTLHMGNKAQEECAEILADEIMNQCYGEKNDDSVVPRHSNTVSR